MKKYILALFIIVVLGIGGPAQAGADYEKVDFQYLLNHSDEYDGRNVQVCVTMVPYPGYSEVILFERKFYLHCPEEAIALVRPLPIISIGQKLQPGKYILYGQWRSNPDVAGMDVHGYDPFR